MPDDKFEIVAPDVEAIDSYLAEKPKAYSAQLLERLNARGAIDGILPLKTTPAARIAIARTIMASSDQKIEDLEERIRVMQRERDMSLASRVLLAANTPIFAAGRTPPAPSQDDQKKAEDKALEDAENRWFSRYLTLRNILGFLVVFVGLVGSVFAFTVSEYEKHSTALDQTIKDLNVDKTKLQAEKVSLEAERAKLQVQVNNLQGQAGPQLAAAKEQVDSLTKQLNQANASLAQATKNLTTAQTNATQAQDREAAVRRDLEVAQQKISDFQATQRK
jgi:DNA repair exonuclease SbcCD ATPase subunit